MTRQEPDANLTGSRPGDLDSGPVQEDVDAEFRALLAGLRTSLPGVQVLFAFLLTAPLQSTFSELTGSQQVVFAIAFYASGLSSILLISPSVHQRVRAPETGIKRHSKRHLIIATWVTIAGSIAMGVAIAATAYLVSSLVLGVVFAAVSTALLVLALVWSWAYLPLVTFRD